MFAESPNKGGYKVLKGTTAASPYRLFDLPFIILLTQFTQKYTV
jgi:hypothetical protein